jgi:hypothetical protein
MLNRFYWSSFLYLIAIVFATIYVPSAQAQAYDEDSLNQLISRLECEGKLSASIKENARLSKQIQDFKVIKVDLTIHQESDKPKKVISSRSNVINHSIVVKSNKHSVRK